MSSSLDTVLRKVQAALGQAAVAGTAHASHALAEAASYARTLDEAGLPVLAEQLSALLTADGRDLTRALADALRSVELVQVYLLRPDGPPSIDMLAWPDDTVLMQPIPDLAEAIHFASELQWAWSLDHNRDALEVHAEWLMQLNGRGNSASVRRRAIEALSFVPAPAVVEGLIHSIDDSVVRRSVVNALVRLGASGEVDVVTPLMALLKPGHAASASTSGADRAALALYRLGAYRELARFTRHPGRIVRCYAGLAGMELGGTPISPVDDACVKHIVRCAEEDKDGGVGDDTLKAIFTLQNRPLLELASYLADTPSGQRLRVFARRQIVGRMARPRRQKACLVLGAVGEARDVSCLIGAAARDLPEAYQALGALGGEEVFAYLTDIVQGRRVSGQLGPAIHALGAFGDQRAVPQLIALLNANPLHSRSAASALAAIGAREAVPHLVARLAGAQPFEAGVFVEALTRIDDPAAVEGFVGALTRHASRLSPSRRSLVRGLIHFGDHSVDAMLGLLSSDDARVRAIAEEVLTNINTPHSREVLDEYLEREPLHHLLVRLTYGSTEVRQQAEREMADMDGSHLAGLLGEALGEGSKASPGEAKALLKAMAGLHHPEIVPQLRTLAADKRPGLAKEAMSTLASFPYVVNRPVFVDQLQRSNRNDVRQAARVLGQQDMTVVDDMLDRLDHPNPGVRAGAIEVLGAKRARWAIDRVMPVFDDPHPQVRLALASNVSHLSVPRLEDDIIVRLLVSLEDASGNLLASLVSALQALACGSAREDVHTSLVAAWGRQGRRANHTLEAIGAIGHPDALRILMRQVNVGNEPTIKSAVVGLSRLGDPAVFSALESTFERVTTTPLFRVLHESMSRLSKGWHRLYRAQVALARGNAQVALADLDAYVADDPDEGSGYFERGRAWHLSGHPTMAYDDYLNAGQRMNRYAPAWYAAALAAHQMGDLESALKHFDQAMNFRRDNAEARLLRGLLYLEKQNFQAALSDFKVVSGTGKASTHRQRVAEVLIDVVSRFADAPPERQPTQVQLLGMMDRALPNRLADLVLIWALILARRFVVARQCLDRFAERWPAARSYSLLGTAWLYAAAGETARAREALADLQDHAVSQGHDWPDFVRYAFSDWPVVGESLTGMLIEAFKE